MVSRSKPKSSRREGLGATRKQRTSSGAASSTPLEAALEISLATLGSAGDFGSLAHYADPAYYDLTYRQRKQDVQFYCQLARSAEHVLEYGCGNGRITLPMARAGAAVTGVDLSKPMLNDFAQRLSNEHATVRERIRLQHADMRKFATTERYPLILAPFNTLLHLYEPAECLEFLARVHEHLADGGRFVFDVSLPQPADLGRAANKRLRAPDFVHPSTGESFEYYERFEYDPIRQLLVVWMEFVPKDGQPGFTIPLSHRQFYPQEIKALLLTSGFVDVSFTSDFSAEAPGGYTDSLVIECRKGTGQNRTFALE
jgi:SAM-dependent methyltransferase